MNSSPEDRQLGEYQLKQLIHETDTTRTWLAEQVSVARRVLVDELKEDQPGKRAAFLADVRAKAAVDHPLVGSVYEAVAEPELCFYAHELLPGVTLEERQAAGLPLSPARLAHVLRRVADANLQHETLSHATSLMDLDAIHLDEHGVIRLKNLAVSGPRSPDESKRDIVHLGSVLGPLVAMGQPGATRLHTLLSWMRGEGLEYSITWAQIRDYCEQIEQQLADPLPSAPHAQKAANPRGKQTAVIISIVTGLALLGIAAVAVKLRPVTPVAAARVKLPEAVSIKQGFYPTPDGANEALPAFRISANEVTIGQYAEFCETLSMLVKDNRERTFDHPDQPAAKVSHEPADWAELIAAAKSNGTWHGQPVTMDSPVVGVDWWDAAAYVEWKQARLPTQEEWFAALRNDVAVPTALIPAGWIPVTAKTTDRTPGGLIGMAGSVCEWTRLPAVNPANPLGDRLWLIIGGSYLKAGSNALSREWTSDRSLRRPDLGFRVVFDVK
jgi:hypothetical protein